MRPPAPSARPRPRRAALLILLGVLAVAIFVVATLPAGVVIGRLEGYGIGADAVGGTVWSGRAQGLAVRGNHLGDLTWSLQPLPLLHGTLAGHVTLTAPDGRIETDFARALSGRLELGATRGDLPLDALAKLGVPFGRNWRGRIITDLSRVVLVDDWPIAAAGIIDVRELTAPPPRNTSLGGYRLSFTEGPDAAPELRAAITQTDGPLLIDGELTLSPDRSFRLDGRVAPRGTPSPELANVLRALGPPDPRGRRPISASGTF